MMPGPMQLLIILVICLILFGSKKLRNIGSDLGGAISEFKSSMEDPDDKNSDDTTSASTSETTKNAKE